jgi:Kef-type K+ transport system membrane component KefB
VTFGVLALIVAAGLAGPLLAAGRRAVVPVVVGELLAGVVIGRMGTGWLDPGEPTVAFMADVGFAMLMFGAGMHVPIRQPGIANGLRRGLVAAAVVTGFAVPAGLAVAHAGAGGRGAVYALLLASGSAAILLPTLDEAGLLGNRDALTVMAQVGIADVAAIVALPLVMQPSKATHAALGGLAVAGAAVAILLVAQRLGGVEVVHRLRKQSKKRAWALDLRLALLVLFTLAWLARKTGTSILIAGFAVGLIVAVIGGPKRLSRQVTGVASGFFVPLFFVALGAKLDLRAVFRHASTLELAVLLVVANVAVHLAGALLTRQPAASGLAATAQLGLPAGVVTLGLQQGTVSPGQAGAILLAALATIGLCPLGVTLLARREPAAPPPDAAASPASAAGTSSSGPGG